MESCAYEEVETASETKVNISTKYFFRQLLVSSGVWMVFFVTGQFCGSPTVIIPQIRREANSSDVISDDMATWIYSGFAIAAIPCVVILSTITYLYGRKLAYILACISLILSYIILYFSKNVTDILISEVIIGVAFASNMTIGILVISEYTSPKYRGIFLAIKSANLLWGVWCANALGTFFHWKSLPMLGLVSSVYTLTVFFWPESPYWLASKGRYDECKKSYRWLHGSDVRSERALNDLIRSQIRKKRTNFEMSVFLATLKTKTFLKPFLLSALLIMQYNFTGKIVITMYSLDIIQKITNNESMGYIGMLILDGVNILALYTGCYLTKVFKRRTYYLFTSFLAISFLFIISGYLFLVKCELIRENNFISILFLVCFSLPICCGPMLLSTSIYAEIIPMEFKSTISLLIGVLFQICMCFLLKISSLIIKMLGVHGTFLFFGMTSGTCTLLLYFFLPETKDKTLQEIEEEYFKEKNES